MEVLSERGGGRDVHHSFLMAGLRLVEGGHRRHEVRRFRCVTAELRALRDGGLSQGGTQGAMESTGVSWRPVYRRRAGVVAVWLVKAQHLKAVAGRKPDVQDAEWLAALRHQGLLKPSRLPTQHPHAGRAVTRLRLKLLQERSRLVNRVPTGLADAGFKLHPPIPALFGVSGRASLQALSHGEREPQRRASLVHARLSAKHDQLVEALRGALRAPHRFLLGEVLCLLEAQERALKHIELQMEHRLPPVEAMVTRLEVVSGGRRRVLWVLFAEVGIDRNPSPAAAHLASWAGRCPAHDESAGNRRRGRTRPGKRSVRAALVQAAPAPARPTPDLGAQSRGFRKRRGSNRAAVAVGHSLLVLSEHLMKTGEPSQEQGAAYLQHGGQQQLPAQLGRRLERWGYQVSLQPHPAA